MGETIRCLMVATAALISLPGTAKAQQAGGGFGIPQSLSAGAGNFGTGGGNSSPRSLGMPDFTSATQQGRVGPRPGGPSTEPTATRDNSWLTESSPSNPNRPSTAPFGSTQENLLRGNQGANSGRAIATVAATEDPQSTEAQMRARANAAANPSSGFGSLPKGISLPVRETASNSSGSFGNQFSRGANQPPGNNTTGPVYGPKTAAEANFDWSIYNTNPPVGGPPGMGSSPNAGSPSRFSPSQGTEYRQTAQQNLGLPDTFATGPTATSAGANGSGLGMPGAASSTGNSSTGTSATNPATLPPTWNYQQIAALGQYFGISSNDSRMSDKAFVNRLYGLYREDQAKQQAGQNGSGSVQSTATTRQTDNSSAFSMPGFQQPSQPQQTPLASDARYANAGQTVPTGGTTSVNNRRKTQLYDSFGNRVDAEGNILDADGRPVDEATRYELTIGKKIREDMARLAKEQAELDRNRRDQTTGSDSDRLAMTDPRQANRPTLDRQAAPESPSNTRLTNDRVRDAEERVVADQAGIGSGSEVIGKSNPYINVFLLCSLVANAFLFVWLHRLWYHHRDLIASSRMAASGISTNE